RFARLTFTEEVDDSVPVETVRHALSGFVESVIKHLEARGIRDTEAHDAWNLVRKTSSDHEQYCRLIGSLGLSPYDEHPDIDKLLDSLSDKLNARVLADLFQASDMANLVRASTLAEQFSSALPSASEISIAPLSDIDVPDDHWSQAWRRGVEATTRVRTAFGIANFDPKGGSQFFEKLAFDPAQASTVPVEETVAGQVSAAFKRYENAMKLAIAGSSDPHRRFAAARAAFLAW